MNFQSHSQTREFIVQKKKKKEKIIANVSCFVFVFALNRTKAKRPVDDVGITRNCRLETKLQFQMELHSLFENNDFCHRQQKKN